MLSTCHYCCGKIFHLYFLKAKKTPAPTPAIVSIVAGTPTATNLDENKWLV